MHERQPRSRIHNRLPICPTLLEPTTARTCPGRALQEQIRVPTELVREVEAWSVGFDVLDLGFGDGVEHVFGPLFDQRHEAAVAEGAIGAAEGEVVGEGRDADGEVGGDIVWSPEVFEVDSLAVDEGEAWDPGGVEASRADYDVHFVLLAFVVDEALFG